jgi:hypothetical protein
MAVGAPLDSIVDARGMEVYEEVFRSVVRVRRASAALSDVWGLLNSHEGVLAASSVGGAPASSQLAVDHATHLLRLHVHELRHFVGGVQAHFIARVCDGYWAELCDAIECSSSPLELRSAHEAYLSHVASHWLIDPAGRAAAGLITSVLALALSLKREVCGGDRAVDGGEAGVAAAGASWNDLVLASRRQFAMLLTALAKEPRAPPELVHPSSVGAFAE